MLPAKTLYADIDKAKEIAESIKHTREVLEDNFPEWKEDPRQLPVNHEVTLVHSSEENTWHKAFRPGVEKWFGVDNA